MHALDDPIAQLAAHTRWRHRAAPDEVQYVTGVQHLSDGLACVDYVICRAGCPRCPHPSCPDRLGYGVTHLDYFLASRDPHHQVVAIKPADTTS